MLKINDLKGFDFSEKYCTISDEFTISKEGFAVHFYPFLIWGKITGLDYHYSIGLEEYDSHSSGFNAQRIFNMIYSRITRDEFITGEKIKELKNLLFQYHFEFEEWNELYSEISRDLTLLKKFNKKEYVKYFKVILKNFGFDIPNNDDIYEKNF